MAPARRSEPVQAKLLIQVNRLLAVLLDAGGAQPGETMLVDRELPGQEFVHGQGVAAAHGVG